MGKAKTIVETITNQIIEDMEKSGRFEIPWENVIGHANLTTNNSYSGINSLVLAFSALKQDFTSQYWLTYKQASKLGANVRKGEKGTGIIFYSPITVERENSAGETVEKTFPMLRAYTVFNVEQCENIDPKFLKEQKELKTKFEEHLDAEQVIKATGAKITHAQQNRAAYSPTLDKIIMPTKAQFKAETGYYSTVFHELCHWTGHVTRLNRDFSGRFGSEAYAFEELVAETGAALTLAKLGFEYQQQHAMYLKSWLKVLKEDKTALMTAFSKAEKASKYVLLGATDVKAENKKGQKTEGQLSA